jgi:ketosteroid isomerase-like protein
MAESEDFYRDFLARFIDAQRAFHDGDPVPNLALWSSEDPVTLFTARGLLESGTEPATAAFRFVASTFSDVEIFHWETLASGVARDFAYTAAVERYTNSRNGGPPEQTELRATHVYRREDGQWRAVHRHADRRPPGPQPDWRFHLATGLTASAAPGIGSARTHHRTCARGTPPLAQ